jgi:hypothetical protein
VANFEDFYNVGCFTYEVSDVMARLGWDTTTACALVNAFSLLNSLDDPVIFSSRSHPPILLLEFITWFSSVEMGLMASL